MVLTPSERRGAVMLVALFALGAARDLWELRRLVATNPVARPVGALHSGSTSPEPPGSGQSVASPPVRPPPSSVVADSAVLPLDLNQATAESLDRLPGVGPVLAARILEYRRQHGRFRTPDELLGVRGVGPRLMERLRLRVSVGGAPPWRLSGSTPPGPSGPATQAESLALPAGPRR